MNTCEFYNYVIENFNLDGAARNLVHNAISYVDEQSLTDEDESRDILRFLLDGIGITDEEINQVYFIPERTKEEIEQEYNTFCENVICCLKAYPGVTTVKSDADICRAFFEKEIFPDYDDRLSDETVEKICESECSPWTAFYDEAQYYYSNCYDYALTELELDIEDELVNAFYPRGLDDEQKEWLSGIINERVDITYPYDHLLKQKVKTDIYVDTGDANYDFSLNYRYPAWGGEEEEEINPKASIRWLAEAQGYSEEELRKELEKGDMRSPKGFLQSLRVELANMPSQLPALVFLAEMTLKDLFDINEKLHEQEVNGQRAYDADSRPDNGSITIKKTAKTGLYDGWDGGGAPFEIQLEKDVVLPLKYIHTALPDKCKRYRWNIADVYSMPGSCWRDVVTINKENM